MGLFNMNSPCIFFVLCRRNRRFFKISGFKVTNQFRPLPAGGIIVKVLIVFEPNKIHRLFLDTAGGGQGVFCMPMKICDAPYCYGKTNSFILPLQK